MSLMFHFEQTSRIVYLNIIIHPSIVRYHKYIFSLSPFLIQSCAIALACFSL